MVEQEIDLLKSHSQHVLDSTGEAIGWVNAVHSPHDSTGRWEQRIWRGMDVVGDSTVVKAEESIHQYKQTVITELFGISFPGARRRIRHAEVCASQAVQAVARRGASSSSTR